MDKKPSKRWGEFVIVKYMLLSINYYYFSTSNIFFQHVLLKFWYSEIFDGT